jgi:hypothetical protein
MIMREKNQKEILELIAAVGSNTSLPQDRVLFALELALEQAVCEYFKVRECQVDIEDKMVTSLFQNFPGIEIDKTNKFASNMAYAGLRADEVKFEKLDKNIVKRCRKLFMRNLEQMETVCLYEKWKRKAHQAVEGVIQDVETSRVKIRLGDNVRGIMLKSEWVPKESVLYRKGVLFWFYVSKIMQEKSGVMVYLSRGSKNFPGALIQEKLPWAKIRAVKRIRGKKTWLESSVLIDPEIIKTLQRELKGEVIEIQCQ